MMLAALALAAGTSAISSMPETYRTDIVRQIKDKLTDGDSAKWRWPEMRDNGSYCGWVNAKNRMGGYSGWTLYRVIGGLSAREPKTYTVIAVDFTSSTRRTIQDLQIIEHCAELGYPIGTPPTE